MQPPLPLGQLTDLIAGLREGAAKHSLEAIAEGSYAHVEGLLNMSVSRKEAWYREIALVALWRAFLNLLPASVLERPEERCRNTVYSRLSSLLGEPPTDAFLSSVMTVVKRLQTFTLIGRQSSSFNLYRATHLALLRDQKERCACCGYKFEKGDLEPEDESGIFSRRPAVSVPVNQFDRSPKRMYRAAVLDHIIPIYLGGDREDNWQILCKTCNSGKSDMIFGFESRAWFGSARKEDLTSVGAQLFYMVLRRDRKCQFCEINMRDTELRVVRNDYEGADLYPNLSAACKDCLSSL